VQTAFDDGTGTRFQVYVWLEKRFYKVTIAEVPESLDLRHRQLSPREQEIAGLITKGLTNKAIAQVLLLRPTTVNTYAKRLFLKLNVSSRAEMVAKVMSENLLERVS
jgi:DNA-binding NarL/FixJ family response regulator